MADTAALVGAAPAVTGVETPLGEPVAPAATAHAAPDVEPAAPVSWIETSLFEATLTGAVLGPWTWTAARSVLRTLLEMEAPTAAV